MFRKEPKTLIVYYSFQGNVKFAADLLAEKLGADVVRLEPDREPPREGAGMYLKGGGAALFGRKPVLLNEKIKLKGYDTLILASPVWAGSYAPAMAAFLKKTKIKKKNIAILASSKSGNAEKMISKMKKKLAGNTVIAELSLTEPLQDKEAAAGLICGFAEKLKELAVK